MNNFPQRLYKIADTDNQAEISRKLNVPPTTLSNWLKRGVSKAGALKISKTYGVNVEYVLTGQGQMTARPSLDELKLKAEAIKAKDTQSDVLSMARPVPVLSWVAAGSWSESNTVTADNAEDWLPRPLGLSEQGFALVVRGESMLPDFHPDDYIYVEPNVLAIALKNGDLVVVQKADGSQAEATFKQLIIGETSDDMYLKPLNPNWHEQKMLPMTEDEWVLVGKVVGRYTKF